MRIIIYESTLNSIIKGEIDEALGVPPNILEAAKTLYKNIISKFPKES